MINHIEGVVKKVQGQFIEVDIGFIGLSLQVPDGSVFTAEQKNKIFIHMHWNQEQGPSLFGFATELDREVFLLVTSCSGLGPKIALAVLSGLGPQGFLGAITQGSESALSKVNGIGAKKAEQMIVQLKHKVAKLIKSGVDLGSEQGAINWNNVTEVLESLNYSRMEISTAMNYLREHYSGSEASFDQLIRYALSFLAKKR